MRTAGASIDVDAVLAACQTSGDLLCKGWDELGGPFPASALDPRVLAVVAQAPGGAQVFDTPGHMGFSDVAMPVMIQGGTADQTTPFAVEQQAPFAELPSPAYLVGIEKAGHFTFSNMCDLVATIGLTAPEFDDGCGPSNIPSDAAHAIANTYATAFFQSYVAGIHDFDAVLDPSTPASFANVAVFDRR